MNPTPLVPTPLRGKPQLSMSWKFSHGQKMFSVSGNDISDIYSDLCFTNYVFFFFYRNARLIVQAQE